MKILVTLVLFPFVISSCLASNNTSTTQVTETTELPTLNVTVKSIKGEGHGKVSPVAHHRGNNNWPIRFSSQRNSAQRSNRRRGNTARQTATDYYNNNNYGSYGSYGSYGRGKGRKGRGRHYGADTSEEYGRR